MQDLSSAGLGVGFLVFLIVAAIWSIIWKGVALWYAARNGHKAWYVIMLILNTVGILEIIYIFAVAKPGKDGKIEEPKPQM